MKKQINEVKRMRKLAGLNENLNFVTPEGEIDKTALKQFLISRLSEIVAGYIMESSDAGPDALEGISEEELMKDFADYLNGEV
jgi:hypothetical protein